MNYDIHPDLEASRVSTLEVNGISRRLSSVVSLSGIWLYQHRSNRVRHVHIIGLDPDDPKNLEGYWALALTSHEVAPIRSITSHSWRKTESQMLTRCQLIGSTHVERSVPELGLQQVFLVDPSGSHLD